MQRSSLMARNRKEPLPRFARNAQFGQGIQGLGRAESLAGKLAGVDFETHLLEPRQAQRPSIARKLAGSD